MKRMICLLLAVLTAFAMSIGVSALRSTSVIPTATLNKLLAAYREALKNGDSYVSLSEYGVSGSAAYEDLFEFFLEIDADLGAISYGKYSETYVYPVIDYNSSTGAISGVKLDYNDRYRKEDGSCDTSLAEKDRVIVTRRYNEAKDLVKHNMSDAEKALVLYDYMITSSDYALSIGKDSTGKDLYPEDSYTAVGFLRDRSAVCAAYSKLYASLLNEAGIPAITVECNEIDHEWVMLQIDGEWYHADPTWDDLLFTDGYTALWDMNNDSWDIGASNHIYFLKSDDEFRELDHPDWNISYSVNPKRLSEAPASGASGAFDDKFFSDKNENYLCCTAMNYINGNWYFADLNSMSVICATYDGDSETIRLPDESIPKYCFGYNNDLYICTNFCIYRYDTVSGSFDKIMVIPEDKRSTDDYSEMRISDGFMKVVTVSYTFDENGDYADAVFTEEEHDMQALETADPIKEENGGAEEVETEAREPERSSYPDITRPKGNNDSSISPDDQKMLDMAEAAGKRISALIYLGIASVFIIFGVIAIVLAIKYGKK